MYVHACMLSMQFVLTCCCMMQTPLCRMIDTLGTVPVRLRWRRDDADINNGNNNTRGRNYHYSNRRNSGDELQEKSRIIEVKVMLAGASLAVHLNDQDAR
jgi:hypothetical protein